MSARILVVDDVLPNVKLLAAKLTREYYEVLTAYGGQDALDKVAKSAPDILLLDVMMPDLDGFEVCRRIKSNPATAHIPIVMVTALSDSEDRVRGLEAGADDFLTKPVNDVALMARIRSLTRLKLVMDEWRMREAMSNQFGVLSGKSSLVTEPVEGARVLVVEDSAGDAAKIRETLVRDSHWVEVVEDGASALQLGQDGDFDFAIISLNLTDEDGLRILSRIRSSESTRHLPILVLGEEEDLGRIVKGLDLGANDYLVRPIDRNELLARTRTQIRRRRYQERLRNIYEKSLSMALTDSLTGLFNRRYLSTHLDRLIERSTESGKAMSVAMFDIDFFKPINDRYGHAAGDDVLKEIADRIVGNVRGFDLVARLGGEEFVVVMPETDVAAAAAVAERLRQKVADDSFPIPVPPGRVSVTVSIGVAASRPGDDQGRLLQRADKALYAAKTSGKNRVVAAEAAGAQGTEKSLV